MHAHSSRIRRYVLGFVRGFSGGHPFSTGNQVDFGGCWAGFLQKCLLLGSTNVQFSGLKCGQMICMKGVAISVRVGPPLV